MDRAIRRLCVPSLFFLAVSSAYGVNPDLVLAPPPSLSEIAWHELRRDGTSPKTVILHAQISAVKGAVSAVTIKDASRWPIASAEVQAWISRHWRFVSAFSGTVIQPVSFKVVRAEAVPTPTPAKTGPWTSRDWSFFERAPKPRFPNEYRSALLEYVRKTQYKAGVLLSMTAKNGAIIDIRVIDQKGPTEFCDYTVKWVRERWLFKPSVSGTYTVPVYYGFGY